ncbi:hypothetical protein NMG60_11032961 [Bertholletia excelsa]
MEGFSGSEFINNEFATRKKRSNMPRRPRTVSCPIPNSYHIWPNDQISVNVFKRSRKHDGGFGDSDAYCRNGSENKLKKVKLKIGGVTHTIHPNCTSEFAVDGGSSATNGFYSSVAPLLPKENINNGNSSFLDMGKSLHRVAQKDFSRCVSGAGNERFSSGKTLGKVAYGNGTFDSEPVRKSKRVPKRRVLDVEFSDNEEDEEIRFLGRLNASKVGTVSEDMGEDNKRNQRNMKIFESGRRDSDNRQRPISEKAYEDVDYVEEGEEPISDEGLPKAERKTLRKESELSREGKKEMAVNHPSQDDCSGISERVIDLPTASLLPPNRSQKGKLSEVDQQLKRAEAAQRRRLQAEKAAREAQAEAIRKILGQDSSRKKREEKLKKQREQAAQGKAVNGMMLAPRTVRLVMSPTGTTVTFSEDIGLPSIFTSATCSYPPPREKCVGPNCSNPYKYRDSKSKLPLCSLPCYKAVHKDMQTFNCLLTPSLL